MKKAFLLLAVIALVSTTGIVHSANSGSVPLNIKGPSVPDAVMATFNGILTDIMNNSFPSNPNYDASGITWTHDKDGWHCNGFVAQIGGNGSGVNVIGGDFLRNGVCINLYYTVVQ